MKKILSLIFVGLLMVSLAFAAADDCAVVGERTTGTTDLTNGQAISLDEQRLCCEGLISTNFKAGEGDTCMAMMGSPGICIACGDGICDSEFEDICNCKKDCGNEDIEPVLIREQVREQLRDGSYAIEGGKQLQIREHAENMFQLESGNVNAEARMEMMQEMVGDKLQLHAKLSNGRNAEVKIMPNTAAIRAQERLQSKVCLAEDGCQIQLKEMMQNGEPKAAYEVKLQKESRFLGMFKMNMPVTANIDAETGDVLNTNKPWWAFLASETNVVAETAIEIDDIIETETNEDLCVLNEGKWIEEHNECEGISQEQCNEMSGSFSECASPCRHHEEYPDINCMAVCTAVCSV